MSQVPFTGQLSSSTCSTLMDLSAAWIHSGDATETSPEQADDTCPSRLRQWPMAKCTRDRKRSQLAKAAFASSICRLQSTSQKKISCRSRRQSQSQGHLGGPGAQLLFQLLQVLQVRARRQRQGQCKGNACKAEALSPCRLAGP